MTSPSLPRRPTAPMRAIRRQRASTGSTTGKRVIITEKPSMGRAVAAALGVTTRHTGYLEGSNDIVTWCVGHLVELDEPEAYNPTWKQWRLADLPICPATFTYHPTAPTRDQFNIIKQLLGRADVTTIVNAADAGREGELIFDLVYTLARCRKPVERLWISSLTREAILTGFRNLQPAAAYRGLRDSARCRQQAANARYAFSAAHTLSLAQALYEKTFITYPRTASRHLSSSVNRELRGHVEAASVGPYLPFIRTILARGNVRLTSRHVDDKKVTDHHAIIPATQRVDPAVLSPDEKRLYDLIARRFLAAFYPDAAIERTTLSTEVEGERFTTRGSVVLAPGWH